MRISRQLNIVVPIARDGVAIYVHAAPISRETFEAYYRPIARAYAAMFAEKFTIYSAPRIAKLLVRDSAQELGMWEGPNGVEQGLFPEIRRLSNVVMPGAKGWVTLPFDDAVSSKQLDDDEIAEVENILVFFICVSVMSLKSDLKTMLGITSAIWKTQDTSSNCTEFASSLQTSTETASSGERAAAAAPERSAHHATHNAVIDGKPASLPH